MATTDIEQRREAIRKALAQREGQPPDASRVAEVTLGLWRQVTAQLSPVIGAHGVDVLFVRALHLTSKAFPWIAVAGEQGNSVALLAGLKARLADREAEIAAEASYTLVVTFTELLETLIGETLTERLLGPVWAPPGAPD